MRTPPPESTAEARVPALETEEVDAKAATEATNGAADMKLTSGGKKAVMERVVNNKKKKQLLGRNL